MKYSRQSPKSEVRSPKSGGGRADGEFATDEALWAWGDEPEGDMVLREDAPPKDQVRDLEERATRFGEAIVRFARKIPQNPANNRLIDQLVGAGTSIGANYSEAKDAVSRKDFKNRVGTSRKESKETMFFLRMIAAAEERLAGEARILWREAKELNLIFGSIWRK
jgi:four helix bundle protein